MSAYIDRELTGDELRAVRAHVEQCDACRAECDDLSQTKRLLSCLAYSAPRAELESLLMTRAARATNPPLLDRILPPEWSDAMLWRWEGIGNLASPRLRPLAATALLSLAGLCLATASVSRPGDESPFGDAPTGQTFAVYVGPTGTLTRVPMMPEMRDFRALHRNGSSGMIPVSLGTTATESSMGSGWMATPSLPATTARPANGLPSNWENELIPTVATPQNATYPNPVMARYSLVIIAPR